MLNMEYEISQFQTRIENLELQNFGKVQLIPADVACLMSEIELLLYRLIAVYVDGLVQQEVMLHIPKLLEAEILGATNRMINRFLELRENQDKTFFLFTVPVEEIRQTKDMSVAEKSVYWAIRSYGNKGVWIKELKSQVPLATKAVDDAVKRLEKLELVKSIKPIRAPIRKLYMLSRFTPAEELVGGVFYSSTDLDKEFISTLSTIIYKFIEQKVFTRDDTEFVYTVAAPHTAGVFPTLNEITKYVNSAKILRVELQRPDVQATLNRLVYSGSVLRKLRPVEERANANDELDNYVYMPLRSDGLAPEPGSFTTNSVSLAAADLKLADPFEISLGPDSLVDLCDIESLHQIPCSTCPVFDLCGETGKITPATCEYYDRWLSFGIDRILIK